MQSWEQISAAGIWVISDDFGSRYYPSIYALEMENFNYMFGSIELIWMKVYYR